MEQLASHPEDLNGHAPTPAVQATTVTRALDFEEFVTP